MKKDLVRVCVLGLGGVLLYVPQISASGIPSFDAAEVINSIQTGASQVEAQVATTMETVSTANIQQSIGDKFGGLEKLKDAKAKAEKMKEKAEKQKKRAEKMQKMREDYEKKAKAVADKGKEAYNKGQEAIAQGQDAYSRGQNALNQGMDTLNEAQDMANTAKQKAEGFDLNTPSLQQYGIDMPEELNGVQNQININQKFNTQSDNAPVSTETISTKGQTVTSNKPALKGSLQKGFSVSQDNVKTADTSVNRFDDAGVKIQPTGSLAGNASRTTTLAKSTNMREDNASNMWDDMEETPQEITITLPVNNKQNALKGAGNIWDETEDEMETDVFGTPAISAVKPTAEKTGLNKSVGVSDKNAINGAVSPVKAGVTKSETASVGGMSSVKKNNSSSSAQTTSSGAKNLNQAAPASANTKSAPAQNTTLKGRTQVKAFDKMSYHLDFKQGFASQSQMKVGTDNDGNFYFPDAFAEWVDINYDDNVDSDKLYAAIQKICSDLQAPENRETGELDEKFKVEIIGKMRATAMAHGIVGANEAESGKAVEDLEKMTEQANDTALTQMSAIGEINAKQIRQNRLDIVRLSDEIMTRVFDDIRKYCFQYEEKKEGEE